MEKPLLEMLTEIRPIEVQIKVPETGLLRIAFLSRELGSLARSVMGIDWNGPEGYLSEMKLSIGDMILQLKLTCEIYDLLYSECEELGTEHFKERIEEYRKNYYEEGKYK